MQNDIPLAPFHHIASFGHICYVLYLLLKCLQRSFLSPANTSLYPKFHLLALEIVHLPYKNTWYRTDVKIELRIVCFMSFMQIVVIFITVFFNSSENSSYFPNGYAHDWYGCIMVTSLHLLLECSFCGPTLDNSLTSLPCQLDL